MSRSALRGFILQPTYRLRAARAEVHLHGVLEDGRSFLLRDGRPTPGFYVAAPDTAAAVAAGAPTVEPSRRTAPDGRALARVELARPADARPLAERLRDVGVATWEADVRFASRYLIDRGIRGSLAIVGVEPAEGDAGGAEGRRSGEPGAVGVTVDEPELSPASFRPTLRVLSLDIETDPRARRLLSVALAGCGAAEVLLLTPEGAGCPAGARPFPTQRELLRALARRIRELDPDVLTGWNVVGFDLRVLERLARREGLALDLGRGPGALRLRRVRGGRSSWKAAIPGRLVLDGVDLLRGAFVKMESYALDAVARELLGRGKTIRGHDRAAEILEAFRSDRPRLVEYNLTDARLVLDILDRLQLVELAVERSLLTGLPPDRVAASVAAFDQLYLTELHRRGTVGPTAAPEAGGGRAGGGLVLRPRPGLYRQVAVLDFTSLYPSIIRTFGIDPLNLLPEGADEPAEGSIEAPNGARFRRRPGILGGMLDELFPRREEAKRRGDRVASHAIKILMNSFYGVLGTPACRFHDPRLPDAVTSFGRALLRWARSRAEEWGVPVLYGDTDSLFLETGAPDAAAARHRGEGLARRLDRALGEHIRATWGVESRLELELESVMLRLFLLPLRGGSGGASKRYAALVDRDGDAEVVLTGLEAVRRDWTDLARRVQRELYERLFHDRPVDAYLRRVVAELRAGDHDSELIYRKALRKRPDEYTSTTPPHVAAARRADRTRRGVVAYVHTVTGPAPADDPGAPLDHEHYVERQIQPVAEPVLEHLGLDFRRVIGDDRQMDLF